MVEYEFGGPAGAVGVMVGLPLVIYGLYFACGADTCATELGALGRVTEGLTGDFGGLYSAYAMGLFMMWMAGQVVLERILPGEAALGVELKDKSRLSYVLSGHLQFWATLAVLLFGAVEYADADGDLRFIKFTSLPLSLIYDHYLGLITASVIFSFGLSTYLYATSLTKPMVKLADGGQTGNVVYDFFIGRELNPRIFDFDLKVFCELRPGLIGWAVINLGCAFKQYENLGYLTAPMLLVNLFQGLYVWDALYYERAILTTMDVTTDGFGFMLAFGDLAWVPFTYSLQARYLVDHDPGLSSAALLCIVLLKVVGYTIFRGANSQKDAFRRDPNSTTVAHLKTMDTKRGRKLLISGWWGVARKINYTGDWLMGLSWCLLCGFDTIIPYFYAIYFGVLLVHRAIRDDHMCGQKYGDDWAKYKAHVPYAFIPYVF
eukprot:CAMPEP_0118888082 /NCGR_PEP_ID=MMETSP1163-20130328/25536_1 /TAXON_ID=124430 /ORGANISM="Phaeomonas parva, Strain CCMP2877" /LENGTH=431 /DNA_ID=CAMNT_0006826645 /DNA_START=268 /DNA_END=1563 /DNA_ORIENTATION=+